MRKPTLIVAAVIAAIVLVTAVGIVLWSAGDGAPQRSTSTRTS